MGSKHIWNLQYREPFAFIGITGKISANEKRSTDLTKSVSVTQIFSQQLPSKSDSTDSNLSKQEDISFYDHE